jgi:YidC/Oxa1 family membrane protein insertase
MLTIIIKLITFPLTYKSYVASAKMKLLKPEIDKLKIKYKDDPQALQMEQMKVQSKSGVNPLGGCLPQLVQMPIWIALYRFFPASIEFRQQPFLWATDLSNFDSIFNLGGFHISLFCVLFCVSQLLMTWYMSKTTDIPDQMKYMQYFFPVMMFFFLNSTSAGLNWYLFAGNIITFILQYVSLNYIIDNNKLKLEMEEKKKKPAKKSLFQQKMEEAMKQRQQNTKK